jgi:thiol-disulfide isomerase/thioredoxin
LRSLSADAAGKIGLLVLIAAGLLATAMLRRIHSGASADLVELHEKQPAKLSPFVDERGAAASVESFRGKVLILNLWAPWCLPCLKEMPALDRLAARLPEGDFAVVALTKDAIGDTPSKRAFDAMRLSRLKLYLDPEGLIEKEVGARGFPTTLILGSDGAPVAYREGEADWDSPEMAARLETFEDKERSR